MPPCAVNQMQFVLNANQMHATHIRVTIKMVPLFYVQMNVAKLNRDAFVSQIIIVWHQMHHAHDYNVLVSRNAIQTTHFWTLVCIHYSNFFFKKNYSFKETCETKICELNEMCTACELTPCNTYSCFNPDGSKIACKFPCKETSPICICKPNYHRVTPGAPCTRLQCSG